MTRADLHAALQWPNIQAFLHVIREGETDQSDRAYYRVNGGPYLTDLSHHPYYGVPTTLGARASGAYQYLGTTWAGLHERYGFTGFSPAEQDEGAVALILEHGAGDAIKWGDLKTAIAKLAGTWVSLPGLGLARAERVFVKYGGVLPVSDPSLQQPHKIDANAPESPPVVPIQGSPMPLLLALLPAVLNLFAPRAQAALQKVTGASPDIVEQFAQSVIGKVQELTGKPDPVQAVAAITADPKPELVAQLEESALDHLDKLMPVLDKLAQYDQAAWAAEENSRDAAAARGLKQAEIPLHTNPTFILAIIIMAIVFLVVFSVLYKDAMFPSAGGFSTDMQAFVIGAIVGAALTAVIGFYFGSSRSSSAKDVVLGELAKRGK